MTLPSRLPTDPPERLPVSSLSVSSVNTLRRCSLLWRFRYIDSVYLPATGPQIAGLAVGAAASASYQNEIDTGEKLPLPDVLDCYSDEFDELSNRQEVDWQDEKPGELKDSAARSLSVYCEKLAPQVKPVAVERKFTLSFQGVQWKMVGYMDLETASGSIVDMKLRQRSMSPVEAGSALQPAAYLSARRAEGQPATGFEFHVLKRGSNPAASVVATTRTEKQLDLFLCSIVDAAKEIALRAENDVWSPAPPGAWWCSQSACPAWRICPYGGK